MHCLSDTFARLFACLPAFQNIAQMYQISNAYYDVIGINARLTDKEENIIGIIETQQQESMSSTVNKLLNLSKKKLGNFM